jgi:hypothetical protein
MKGMAMKRLLLLAPLALAACNSQPSVNVRNASVAEVAKAAGGEARALRIQPGQWTHKSELRAFDIEGAKDPRMAEMMKRSMARMQETTFTSCVTQKEADNPSGAMFRHDNGECRFEHFRMGGGRLDARMVCRPRQGGETTVTMAGSYTATAYETDNEMVTRAQGGPFGAMHIKTYSQGARTGACPAGEASGTS